MNAIPDYKSMLKREYIDKEKLSNLNAPEIRKEINSLYLDLEELDNQSGVDIKKALILMTKLYCYRSAIDMNITASVVPDSKDPENKYIQARGAVQGLNKKRIWISHYLGPEGKYLGKNNNIIPLRIKKEGRIPIIKKTIEKFWSQLYEL
jgi:hypothetical protein